MGTLVSPCYSYDAGVSLVYFVGAGGPLAQTGEEALKDQATKDQFTDAEMLQYPARLEEIQELLKEAVASEPSLRLMPKFAMARAGNPDFHRVYFAIHCTCGTAGLVCVETAKSKTLPQVEDALPSLAQHLLSRAKQFASMPCSMHTSMRSMGIQASMPGSGGNQHA